MAGCWLLVAGGCWDWFYSKTNGFASIRARRAVAGSNKTNGFSTISVAGSIKPMVFQHFRLLGL